MATIEASEELQSTAATTSPLAGRVERFASRAAYGNAVFWGVVFAVGGALQYHYFLLPRYDLGNYTQAIWATAHGHFLSVTEVGGEQVSRLGIHFDPIIVALVPIWWVWSSPVMLLVVEAVALTSGAVPLFWLARKHLGSDRGAALISAAYLLCPTIQWNAMKFHAVALAVPLLLFAIWFLDEDRLPPFVGVSLLIVVCKEQLGLTIACLGLWYAWRHKRLRPGLGIALAGALASAIEFGVVIRHFSGGSPYTGRYATIGGSFGGILHNLVTDPLVFVRALHPAYDALAIVALMLPVLALSMRSAITLAVLPQVAIAFFSDNASDVNYQAQLILPMIPFLYAGAVFALARYRETGRYRAGHVLVASLASAAVLGPFSPYFVQVPTSARLAAERHAVALVPAGAAVSTTNRLGGHLGARRRLDVFPVTKGADWIVVDAQDPYLPHMRWLKRRTGIGVGTQDLYSQPKLMRKTLRRLNASADWQRVYFADGVSVFKHLVPVDGTDS